MNRITQVMELINQYDNELNDGIKFLIKDIIKEHRLELKEWMNLTTHQSNIEHSSTGA